MKGRRVRVSEGDDNRSRGQRKKVRLGDAVSPSLKVKEGAKEYRLPLEVEKARQILP